jgi:hypothetical protein
MMIDKKGVDDVILSPDAFIKMLTNIFLRQSFSCLLKHSYRFTDGISTVKEKCELDLAVVILFNPAYAKDHQHISSFTLELFFKIHST